MYGIYLWRQFVLPLEFSSYWPLTMHTSHVSAFCCVSGTCWTSGVVRKGQEAKTPTRGG